MIVLDRLIIESTVKAEDYKKAADFDPELLHIRDENGDELFNVVLSNGKNSFSKYGVSFGSVNADGYPAVSIPLRGETRDEKLDEAAKLILIGEKNLKAIESNIRENVSNAEEKYTRIKEAITVIS